ncbi:proprotein convertase P-domain-containing protein [Dactylosporangium sp. NPDC049140]|uniref:CBM96 family carbohydrate-binding protein n=1 Tax=Dactylosporangium sp. NPDC049140 TaxID=3155647 RepID=UPI0033E6571D
MFPRNARTFMPIGALAIGAGIGATVHSGIAAAAETTGVVRSGAAEDTYSSSARPTYKFGASPTVVAGRQGGDQMIGFLKFKVATPASGATVKGTKVTLTRDSGNLPGTLTLSRVADTAWLEKSLSGQAVLPGAASNASYTGTQKMSGTSMATPLVTTPAVPTTPSTPATCTPAVSTTPVAIADRATVASKVTVANCAGTASRTATVKVAIAHLDRGDLIAPDGTDYKVKSSISADDVAFGTATYTVDLNGIWTLQVKDVFAGDAGTLTGWTLTV